MADAANWGPPRLVCDCGPTCESARRVFLAWRRWRCLADLFFRRVTAGLDLLLQSEAGCKDIPAMLLSALSVFGPAPEQLVLGVWPWWQLLLLPLPLPLLAMPTDIWGSWGLVSGMRSLRPSQWTTVRGPPSSAELGLLPRSAALRLLPFSKSMLGLLWVAVCSYNAAISTGFPMPSDTYP